MCTPQPQGWAAAVATATPASWWDAVLVRIKCARPAACQHSPACSHLLLDQQYSHPTTHHAPPHHERSYLRLDAMRAACILLLLALAAMASASAGKDSVCKGKGFKRYPIKRGVITSSLEAGTSHNFAADVRRLLGAALGDWCRVPPPPPVPTRRLTRPPLRSAAADAAQHCRGEGQEGRLPHRVCQAREGRLRQGGCGRAR